MMKCVHVDLFKIPVKMHILVKTRVFSIFKSLYRFSSFDSYWWQLFKKVLEILHTICGLCILSQKFKFSVFLVKMWIFWTWACKALDVELTTQKKNHRRESNTFCVKHESRIIEKMAGTINGSNWISNIPPMYNFVNILVGPLNVAW